MKKQLIMIIMMIISLLWISGCEGKEHKTINDTSSQAINIQEENNIEKQPSTPTDMIHEHCTRGGSVEEGEVSLNYDLYYTGEVLNTLVSEEKVISNAQSVLEEYDSAYKKINSYYIGLKGYDTKVEKTTTSVARQTTIHYDTIDIAKLLEIEGEEDNIIENGIAKVEKWKELAGKFGTTCEVVK